MKEMTDENYIALICNGEFDAIPGFLIGELFELFFDKINYNVVKKTDKTFVDFTGETICNDKDSKILIRFIVNGEKEEFAITAVKVDNEILSEEDVMDLLDNIAFVAETVWEEENGIGEISDDLEGMEYDDDIAEVQFDNNINTGLYNDFDDEHDSNNYNNNDSDDKENK